MRNPRTIEPSNVVVGVSLIDIMEIQKILNRIEKGKECT